MRVYLQTDEKDLLQIDEKDMFQTDKICLRGQEMWFRVPGGGGEILIFFIFDGLAVISRQKADRYCLSGKEGD